MGTQVAGSSVYHTSLSNGTEDLKPSRFQRVLGIVKCEERPELEIQANGEAFLSPVVGPIKEVAPIHMDVQGEATQDVLLNETKPLPQSWVAPVFLQPVGTKLQVTPTTSLLEACERETVSLERSEEDVGTEVGFAGPEEQNALVEAPALVDGQLIHEDIDRYPRWASSPVGLLTAQCARCLKWRVIPSKESYEAIREHINELPFLCERAREWRADANCDVPTDLSQDDSRLWAIDKPNIPSSPPGWHRKVIVRRDCSTKFADVYYVAPSGKTLRSMVEVGKYIQDHPESIPNGATLNQFSFSIPQPMPGVWVKKSRIRSGSGSSTSSGKGKRPRDQPLVKQLAHRLLHSGSPPLPIAPPIVPLPVSTIQPLAEQAALSQPVANPPPRSKVHKSFAQSSTLEVAPRGSQVVSPQITRGNVNADIVPHHIILQGPITATIPKRQRHQMKSRLGVPPSLQPTLPCVPLPNILPLREPKIDNTYR